MVGVGVIIGSAIIVGHGWCWCNYSRCNLVFGGHGWCWCNYSRPWVGVGVIIVGHGWCWCVIIVDHGW